MPNSSRTFNYPGASISSGRRLVLKERIKTGDRKLYQIILRDTSKTIRKINLHEVEFLLLPDWRLGEYTNSKRKIRLTNSSIEVHQFDTTVEAFILDTVINLESKEIDFIKQSCMLLCIHSQAQHVDE